MSKASSIVEMKVLTRTSGTIRRPAEHTPLEIHEMSIEKTVEITVQLLTKRRITTSTVELAGHYTKDNACNVRD